MLISGYIIHFNDILWVTPTQPYLMCDLWAIISLYVICVENPNITPTAYPLCAAAIIRLELIFIKYGVNCIVNVHFPASISLCWCWKLQYTHCLLAGTFMANCGFQPLLLTLCETFVPLFLCNVIWLLMPVCKIQKCSLLELASSHTIYWILLIITTHLHFMCCSSNNTVS